MPTVTCPVCCPLLLCFFMPRFPESGFHLVEFLGVINLQFPLWEIDVLAIGASYLATCGGKRACASDSLVCSLFTRTAVSCSAWCLQYVSPPELQGHWATARSVPSAGLRWQLRSVWLGHLLRLCPLSVFVHLCHLSAAVVFVPVLNIFMALHPFNCFPFIVGSFRILLGSGGNHIDLIHSEQEALCIR